MSDGQVFFTETNTAPNVMIRIDPVVGQPFDTKVFKPFMGSFVYDPDPGDEITLTVKLDDPAKGVFLGYTVGHYDPTTGIYTFKGTSNQASGALNDLWFDPRDRNGVGGIETTTFTATVVDRAGAVKEATAVLSVNTTVDKPPTVIFPTEVPVVADTELATPFAGIQISDAEDAVLTVDVFANGGSLFKVEINGSRTLVTQITGKAAEVQAVLRELKFDPPDRNGSGSLVETVDFFIWVDDGTHLVRTGTSVHVTTAGGTPSAAPILTLPAQKEVTIADTQQALPFAGISLTDDSASVTVTITFDPAKGELVRVPGSTDGNYDPETGTFVVTGHPILVEATLQKLQFNPKDRPNDAAGSVETTTFTIKVQDGEHTIQNSELKAHSVASGSVVPPPVGGNTAPTDIALSGAAAIRELSAIGTTIGDLSATDAPGSTFTYALVGDGAGGRFKVEGNQVKVANSLLLDYEQTKSHTIRVKVTNQGGLSFEKDVSIAVTDWVGERAKGTSGKDVLAGGLGNDQLWGGYGNDVLTGGKGKAVFVFNAKNGSYKTDRKVNFDKITDFNVKDDRIWLENKIFTKLGKKGSEKKPAKLNKEFFIIGTKALEKDDYLIYNKKTGVLSYDKDGSGKGKAVEIAQLKKGLPLKHDDFFVI
jgi:Ca2+-binding RTX toxin-like protein